MKLNDLSYDTFTFESLAERAKVATVGSNDCPENDPEALFMWRALVVASTARRYIHLSIEDVFESLKTDVPPQQKIKNEVPITPGCPNYRQSFYD